MINISKNINIFGDECDEIIFSHSLTNEQSDINNFHSHDFCEMIVYISGEVGYIVEGNYHVLQRGDIMLLAPNEIHKVVLQHPTKYERFFISFPVSCFSRMHRGIASPISCMTDRTNGEKNMLKLPEEYYRDTIDLLYRISALITTEPSGWELSAYAYLLWFLDTVNTCFQNRVISESGCTLSPLLDKILCYVNNNFKTIKTIEKIADKFEISPSYLSRIFKKNMNISLNQYILAKRISHSKVLLAGDMSVAEVCTACGFNDCSHFITVFKKMVGTTPYKYKHSGSI